MTRSPDRVGIAFQAPRAVRGSRPPRICTHRCAAAADLVEYWAAQARSFRSGIAA